MREAGTDVDADDPGWPAAARTTLRLLVGWSCAALGVLDLAMGLTDPRYVLFHGVLLAGGILLLALGLLPRRPTRPAYLAGAAVTVLGLVVSALPRTSPAFCCLGDHPRRHGFPFTMLAEGAGFDLWHAFIDLVFWACVGLFALVAGTLIAPARRPAPTWHAEPGTRAEVADDENVGGLP